MLKNILLPSFSGTISRRAYWLSILVVTIVSVFVVGLFGDKSDALSFIFVLLYDTTGGFILLPVMALMPLSGLIFLFFIPSALSGSFVGLVTYVWVTYSALILVGLQVRRLRDRNKSALYTLLPFIPVPIVNFVGLGYLIYLLSSRSKEMARNGIPQSNQPHV